MELQFYLFLFTFPLLLRLSSGMQCYRCDPERTYGNEDILCEHFDRSERYITNCEHSTMCYKRDTSLDLGNGLSTTTTQRGCALQTMSGDQAKINGKWRPVNTIYDVYNEGCAEDPSDIERATTTVYCYCRGDLCNSAGKHYANLYVLLTVIIGLFIS
ncbi:unnamed protein product [Parnassius mnemosyne]|uniref:Protein sleepless n=1 Tax=Parnassius mnemosyne TaxID=213953 RepID=A0AAV1L4Z5_9NEOP